MPQPTADRRRPKPKCRRLAAVYKAAPPAVAVLTLLTGTSANVDADVPTPVATIDAQAIEAQTTRSLEDFFQDPIFNGKFSLNVRLRAEIADQDGKKTSQAYTERTRLGYTSDTQNPLYFRVELEDIHAIDEDQYNAAGFNGQPEKTVIADPEDTELNQAFIHYNLDQANTSVRFGRQRIKIDDDRFIGNVGWRQNEQTFDAVMFKTMPTEKLDFTYAYIWDVHRIFGPNAGVDFDSNSHLIHLSYDDATFGKITGFAYLLDLDGTAGAAASSSNTYGVRYEATRELNDQQKLNYVLSWANQKDAADNATDYSADYYLIDVKLINDGWYVGGGWEVLESDNGVAAFQTPLATGHKFNGWADVFLTTPADGLEDTYLYLGGDLPHGYKGKAVFHWFDPETGGRDFGNEFDTIVSKKLNDHATALAKYAYYYGSDLPDRVRFWLQLELVY